MTDSSPAAGANDLRENFEDFFEQTLCGYLIADVNGRITRANKITGAWAGSHPNELTGKRFSDLLSIAGKIYYETHLAPMLRMQGFFDEVVLEMSSSAGVKLRVLVTAFERRNQDNIPLFTRYTILKATDRLLYEKNLQTAKNSAEAALTEQTAVVALREQLIAVLGHDLRNPLAALSMATDMLIASSVNGDDVLLAIIKRSSLRMKELVNNIMDFARTRLGEGILLNLQFVLLQPVLLEVVEELKLIHPRREITTDFNIIGPVNCDANRIAQLLSNLVGNAITHGAENTPVMVKAAHNSGHLIISVTNKGVPIPAVQWPYIFTPFTRETTQLSKQGLGLGLYISAEIARAHHATLAFTSNETETCFTFDRVL